MHIRITREALVAARACPSGLEWFDGAAVGGVISGKWTRDTQLLAICTGLAPWWGWAVSAGIVPGWSMAVADLSGADLTGADLRGADLRGADLCGADLRGASLRGAELRRADLCGANLCGADLTRADLCGAARALDVPPIPGWVVENDRLWRATP